MKRLTAIVASFALTAFAALSLAGSANAAGESVVMDVKMPAAKGTLYKEAPKPVKWSVDTKINVPPGSPSIEPLQAANLQMPTELSFHPNPKMPVCSDKKVNATTVSVPVETIIKACPNSIIGNGTAEFALAQSTALARKGVQIVFNGGLKNGLPRLKIYAYSYDTEVGLYTEAVLKKNGQLFFPIPPLTADSSVTALNLSIPGVPTTVEFPMKGITAKLPAGQDPNYAQATCKSNTWNWGGAFILGDRPEGAPPGPTTTLNAKGTTSCTGAAGKAKFAAVKVKGPASVKAGKKGTFKVTVKNTGTAIAKGVKIAVSGKGASGKASGGNIAPGKSKTIKVKAKFTKKGKVKTKFKVTAKKTAAKTGTKSVKVK